MASIKKAGSAADEAQHGLSDRTLATPGSYPRNTTEGSQSDENPINALLALLYAGVRNGTRLYMLAALEEYYRGRLVNNRHEADALLRRDCQQKEETR